MDFHTEWKKLKINHIKYSFLLLRFKHRSISHFEFYNIAHTLHIRVAHEVHTIIRTGPISAIVERCCCCCSDACVCVQMCVYIQFTTECQTMCKRYACECDRARKNQYMKWYYFTFSKWNLLSSLAQCVALLFSLRYPHDVVWMVGLRSQAYTACMRVCVFLCVKSILRCCCCHCYCLFSSSSFVHSKA